jgi:hypothetical protein
MVRSWEVPITVGLILLGAWMAWYHTPQKPAPARPAEPVRPAPIARPSLVVVTQAGCGACVKLKAELGGQAVPFPVTWVDALRPEAAPWKATETPTLIKVDAHGKELSRRTGYVSHAELLAWMTS